MAILGDKNYNYNYYGVPVDRKWSTGIDTAAVAALVRPNIWGYWPSGIYYDDGQYTNTEKNGKPLDDTVAVWRLPRNASFACNAFLSVDISSTLNVHYDVNIENSDVPLAVAAIDVTSTNWGKFDRKCVDRYAYDTVMACNGPRSVLAYDITFNTVCLRGGALLLTRSSNTITGVVLADIASTVGNNNDIDLCVIRPLMYRGGDNVRISDPVTIPDYDGQYFDGVLLADTLSTIPIPDGQTYLKSLIADIANGHNYRSDVIYRPFVSRYGINVYNGSNDSTYTSQLEIGYNRQFTRNNITSGAATISGANKITGMIYRCNYDVKTFDDVVYQWEDAVFDTVNKVDIENGFPIGSAATNQNYRFYSRLKIIDPKGNTRGKALELAVKHELAYIGFYFSDTQAGAESKPLGTGDGVGVYLPEIVGGVTTGRYFTGDDIKNVPYATSGSVADDAFVYRPEETGSDSGDLDTHLHSDSMSGSTQWYALDELDVHFMSQWLNTTYKPDSTQLSEDFKGVNPSDYIVSLRYFPFDVPTSGSTEALSIGGVSVEVSGNTITVDKHSRAYGEGSNSFYDLGSFALQPPYIFGDFRDTYIKLLLYIPWCGFVTLDPALFCQSPDGTYHSIRAALSIDFATGTALGMIYRDNRLIDTINGTVGVDVPMSAVANGSYQNAIKQTEIALKNAKAQQLQAYLSTAGALAGGIVSAATGNVMGVAASAAAFAGAAGKTEQLNNTIEGLEYQLTHTAPSIGDISSASPFNNALSEQAARIFIFKPAMLSTYDAAAYGRTTGYACCKQGTLSQFSGFTVCADVDLSGFDAPAHHKAAIKQALQKGVYL